MTRPALNIALIGSGFMGRAHALDPGENIGREGGDLGSGHIDMQR